MTTKILLDANALIGQHFLKGHLGVALVLAVRQIDARLVLPEVTALEASHHTLALYLDRTREIEKTTDQLQVLVGRRPNVDWPTADVIRAAIEDHLHAIQDIVERVPLDLEVVRGALSRVVEHRPPAHAREEFRDCVLWETALRLAKASQVHLVTSDGDFLVPKGGSRSLHSSLANEIAEGGLSLQHHMTIADLLDSLGPQARQPDPAKVAQALEGPLRQLLQSELASKGVTIQQYLTPQAKAFATPDPNRLAISFEAPFRASATSPSSSSSVAATVSAFGSASLDPRTQLLSEVALDMVDVQYEGGGRGGITYLRAGDSSQTSWRPYDFRYPLDQ